MNSSIIEDYVEGSTIKVLLATDVHLGFKEKHPIRENDSFVAFEEILKIAVREEVDFILLGGDLFHDCKPSPYCILKCSELIRKYCFGDKPVNIEYLSDQSKNFRHMKNPVVNYEDPNINVSIPIFSINGNHDDPTGSRFISAVDLLSTNGLINYFGRWSDLQKVEVEPILLQKGSTRLALYGLSHIHDQRLARLFRDEKVTMVKCSTDNWFNLLVLHQNRANRGTKNFIPESAIPDFMHLAVWGHEHDCRIDPEITNHGVYITQPGSSVATSLTEGESKQKHVGLLLIKDQGFIIKNIPLETVRPFIFKTLTLDNPEDLEANGIHDVGKHTWKVVINELNGIIKRTEAERKAKKQKEMLPLIRLVVRYHTEEQQFNAIRMSQQFVGKVANHEDVVLQKQIPKTATARKRFLADDTNADMESDVDEVTQVKDLVNKELIEGGNKMRVLSIAGMGAAISRIIDCDDADAVLDLMKHQIKLTADQLKEMEVNDKNIDELVNVLYQKRTEAADEQEIAKLFNDNRQFKRFEIAENDVADVSMDGDAPNATPTKPARGRGSRGGRVATRKPRGKAAK